MQVREHIKNFINPPEQNIARATEVAEKYRHELKLLLDQHAELSASLLEAPDDPKIMNQLEKTEHDIARTEGNIKRLWAAIGAEERRDLEAEAAALYAERQAAIEELHQLGQEEIKLAQALHKHALNLGEVWATMKELHERTMATARQAGVSEGAMQYVRMSGYDHALGAILEELGVRQDITLPAPSVAFKGQSPIEVAKELAGRLHVAAQKGS